MNLAELNEVLRDHAESGLTFVLPDGRGVPDHFHVTEVGRVRKDFVDCGGTARSAESCVLQLWVAKGDEAHRLEAGKLGRILASAEAIFREGGVGLPVEVEYDVGVITQFVVTGAEVEAERIVFRLGSKHTACLAPERCAVDVPSSDGSGCCEPNPMVSLGGLR